VELTRQGPGLLLRDLLRDDPQAQALAATIATVAPDILVLTNIDFDHGLAALSAFSDLVAAEGHVLSHQFARRPNTGWQSGLDLDGDGRTGTPDDAQGYGEFAGVGGMAILSRLPFGTAQDFSEFLWQDLPDASLPSVGALDVQRLASTGFWAVPVQLSGGATLDILAYHAGPPVFGNVPARNASRNHDETRFWSHYLDGRLPFSPPQGAFVLIGDSNLDPVDGNGRHAAMRSLLANPRLQDPMPRSSSAITESNQSGDPTLDTARWTGPNAPGALRVDYVLPSAELNVLASGIFWSDPTNENGPEGPSRHGLVWVDVEAPNG
jgi:hypothetical protein